MNDDPKSAPSGTANAPDELRVAELDVVADGGGVRVSKRLCCPRCKEGTTFVISVKDAPGLWISCGACKWIINSAISGAADYRDAHGLSNYPATANTELRQPQLNSEFRRAIALASAAVNSWHRAKWNNQSTLTQEEVHLLLNCIIGDIEIMVPPLEAE